MRGVCGDGHRVSWLAGDGRLLGVSHYN
jgi:hypothetical protein